MNDDDTTDIEKEIGVANSFRYGDIHEVEGYLSGRYHALRIKLAIGLLDEELKKSFPIKEKKELKVLELASATGKVAKMISDFGYDVTASDCEEAPLKEAQKRNLKCSNFNLTGVFPFEDANYNAIFAGEIIEHLLNTGHFLQEVHRLLTPNGILVLTTPNLAALQDRMRLVIGRSPRQTDPAHEYRKLHIRPLTYHKLVSLLKQEGFRDFRIVSNYVRVELPGSNKYYIRSLARLFPNIGGSLIVSARR